VRPGRNRHFEGEAERVAPNGEVGRLLTERLEERIEDEERGPDRVAGVRDGVGGEVAVDAEHGAARGGEARDLVLEGSELPDRSRRVPAPGPDAFERVLLAGRRDRGEAFGTKRLGDVGELFRV